VQLERQSQDWNDLAEMDPYWAILSRPGKRFGGWDNDEFFATGAADAAAVMERLDRLERPERRERALDFGCGFGRMTRGFSEYFDECVGVDISEKMVEGARQLNADRPGLSFVVNGTSDLAQFDDGSFDFVHSVIVLQHVPDRPTIESYIREFVRLLRPGGIAVFQLPSHIPAIYRLHWRRHLYSGLRRLGVDAEFLYKRLRLVPSAMSYIPENDVVRLLESVGARTLDIERYGAGNRSDAGVRSSTYYAGP
jgi:SAM-dependent methyltransferase